MFNEKSNYSGSQLRAMSPQILRDYWNYLYGRLSSTSSAPYVINNVKLNGSLFTSEANDSELMQYKGWMVTDILELQTKLQQGKITSGSLIGDALSSVIEFPIDIAGGVVKGVNHNMTNAGDFLTRTMDNAGKQLDKTTSSFFGNFKWYIAAGVVCCVVWLNKEKIIKKLL